ncbi:hypothetical protein LTR62_000735 [Meristemomyces frigidus]|uniref:Fe2OG dioxygenase domain-containing protein n=1 Tax=Meristemomyces frigidus TaxID=1508187 RepID=A0AAN7T9W7_9PEZI|nr:hypothetical protein LTR62_000735 [Meristemomyces frigidus]
MPSRSKHPKASELKRTGKGTQASALDHKPSTKNVVAKPIWPPLLHLPSAADLTLRPILTDQILTISGFWTSGLSKSYISFLSGLPLLTTPGNPRKGDAVRVNDRFQVDDAEFAEKMWSSSALKELVEHVFVDGKVLDEGEKLELWGGEVLGLNSNIRIYRYVPGQFFDQHYDESNSLVFRPSNPEISPIPARTTWTLLLYLSSCQGGETAFYPEAENRREGTPEPVVVETEVGMALLHRHGRDCLLHEGREVKEGVKWVIRSDLCVRR